MKLDCERHVNKDKILKLEFRFKVALMDRFCEWVCSHFASFHLGSPWGHWAKILRLNPTLSMVWTELGMMKNWSSRFHFFNPHPPKGGCCSPLRFFENSVFYPINCAKRFYVIVFTSITHLLMYLRWKLGVPFGYGVIKDYGRGW